jgi:hypothetical protein
MAFLAVRPILIVIRDEEGYTPRRDAFLGPNSLCATSSDYDLRFLGRRRMVSLWTPCDEIEKCGLCYPKRARREALAPRGRYQVRTACDHQSTSRRTLRR